MPTYISERRRAHLQSLAADVAWPPGSTADRAFAELQDECADFAATSATIPEGQPWPKSLTHGLTPSGDAAPVRVAAEAWVAEARARRTS
jgi:hypothetical protein